MSVSAVRRAVKRLRAPFPYFGSKYERPCKGLDVVRGMRGEDGGCFAAALASVRAFCGVLEHPAYSDAWAAFDLPAPPRAGGWTRGLCGGWTCHVEQGRYGHPAKKATWLYAFGTDLPTLRWGAMPDHQSSALVSWCGNKTRADEARPRLSRVDASATPPEFRAVLLAIARSATAPGGS